MKARVAVLGKVASPVSPSQSRPITVLSNLYRLWARVFCQQVIQVWSQTLPPCIRGCLKGRCAQDISYWMQQVSETHTISDVPCSGLVMDLRKAFNLLPRAPIGSLLRLLGLPAQIVNFWLGSLARLQRLFQVQGHLSPPVHSSTGIPEGDPISVLGMVSFCWLFVVLVSPYVEPTAYVDNLAWSTELQEAHAPALDQVIDLVTATKMQIDWGKSYFWATHAHQRSWWRQGSHVLLPPGIHVPVLHHVKELGAHLNFCKRRGLGHLVDTFDQAVARLHKLYHDPSSIETKAHVVQTGIWPFAFYGALAVAPGRQRLHKLRSNAARAVVGRHHTLSPYAALYFVPGITDPETYLMSYQACHLARTARLIPSVAQEVLKVASRPGSPLTVHGPGSALQVMFGRLGWVISAEGIFKGPGNVFFNVYTSSFKDIKHAIQESWAVEVQNSVLDRSGLAHFPLPSRAVTLKFYQHFEAWEQTILSRHVTGAFLSNAEKSTWSRVVGESCELCGSCDTKHHRLFSCPAMADVREDHREIVDLVQTEFPWWPYMFAAQENGEQPLLRLICNNRVLPPLLPPPIGPRRLFIFTDGSAHNGDCPEARLTYWSVVWCHVVRDEGDLPSWDCLSMDAKVASFRVVAQGCTPRGQSVPRAELAAVVWAAKWALQQQEASAVIFTDSQFVIDQWEKIRKDPSVPERLCHADLLDELPISSRLELRKVKAHNKDGHALQASRYLRWSTMGNEVADKAARLARQSELELVRQLSDSVCESARYQQDCMLAFGKYLVDLNVAEISRKSQLDQPMQVAFAPADIGAAIQAYFAEWDSYHLETSLLPNLPDGAYDLLQGQQAELRYDHALLTWLEQLEWPARPQVDELPLDVTFLELFVSFSVHSGILPPFQVHGPHGQLWFDFESPEGMQQPECLDRMVARFLCRVRRLEVQLKRDLFLATGKYGISRLRALGASEHLAGVDARPLLPDIAEWIPVLLELLRQPLDDGAFLHEVLSQRNIGG